MVLSPQGYETRDVADRSLLFIYKITNFEVLHND